MSLYTVHADDHYYPHPAFHTADSSTHNSLKSAITSAFQIMEDGLYNFIYIVDFESGRAPVVVKAWQLDQGPNSYEPCQEILLHTGKTQVQESRV